MTVDELNLVLLVGAAVLLAAIVAVRLSSGSGLPSLLVYLGLGVLIGERGLGLRFDDADLTVVLGYAALVLILAEGGLTTRWSTIRSAVAPAAALATIGVVVSILIAGAAAKYILDVEWTVGLLVGAAVTSTDAAAVFSVLRRLPLPSRLVGTLEAESGFNDAPVVIVVIALTEAASGHGSHHGIGFLLVEAVSELAIGTAVGLLLGWLGGSGLRRIALPSSGLYPIAVMALAVTAYGAAAVLHGSGFLAVYLCALVLGNTALPHRAATRSFAEGLGWIAQIGLFVLLGLLADPVRLLGQVWPAIAVGLVLLLVARPLSVFLSVSWFGIPFRQQILLSWAGLRGAVPVVLAAVPLASDVPGSERIFDVVFLLVVVFTLVQGPTLPWVAARLGLSGDVNAVDLEVESSPLGALGADVLQLKIGPESRMHGTEIFELRLPEGANITLVVRDGKSFVPTQSTMLRHLDDLIVVVPSAVRELTERRLAQVNTGGKLAGWREPAPPPGHAHGVAPITGTLGQRALAADRRFPWPPGRR